MPSTAEQPELHCRVLPIKPVMACNVASPAHLSLKCFVPTKLPIAKNPKQVKETNKKTPIAPQQKEEKQAAEIVKQPKLWSLKQLIVNENKHIQDI